MITRKSMFESATRRINAVALASAQGCDNGVHYARTTGVAKVALVTMTTSAAISGFTQKLAAKALALAIDRMPVPACAPPKEGNAPLIKQLLLT